MKTMVYTQTHRNAYRRLLGFLIVVYALWGGQLAAQINVGIGGTPSVVNAYFPVSAISGNAITIGSGTGVAHSLAVGDLVLVAQMTGNTAANGGKFEYRRVTAVSGASITVDGITRAYSPATEKVQLVWVPYDHTSITIVANILAQPWNGTTGGIVSVVTDGTLTMNGSILANGAGFRGLADESNLKLTETAYIYGEGVYGGGGSGGNIYASGGGGGGYGASSGATGQGGKGGSNLVGGIGGPSGGGAGADFGSGTYIAPAGINGGGGSGDFSKTGSGGIGGGGGSSNAVTDIINSPWMGGGGGGGGVGGGGGGGSGGPHSGGGGGGASPTQAGCGGTGADNAGNTGGVGAINGIGWTDGVYVGGVIGHSGGAGGGGGGAYTGGGAGVDGSGAYTTGAAGGGYVPASGYHQYFNCDGSGNCSDPRIWMAGGGQNGNDGGGVVMVKANQIITNGQVMAAIGEDGNRTGDRAWGAGGGGLIVVNTNQVTGTLALCAKGGDGAQGGSSDNSHGMGSSGGGGNGVIWVNDPLGAVTSNINATATPPVVANMSFCNNGGLGGPQAPNPKSATFSGGGGCGGGGVVQVNPNCAVFGGCCNPPVAPTGTAAARCGTGTVTLSASGCNATYPAVWYSDAALTTQVGTGDSFTTPSLTSTTTYYVACVKDATCLSTGVAVEATINPQPTVTADITPATCNENGTATNNDGQLSLSGFGPTDHYEYTVGATYTGSATYATATAIPVSGILVSNLANPAAVTVYTVRVFNSGGCYVDVTAVLGVVTCSPNCFPPSPTGTPATRCGTGTVTLSASGCDATYPAVWYSDAALTTQVGTGNSFTTPSLTSTTTYYVACMKNATCLSAGVAVDATINPLATGATAVATPATCNAAGTAANNDGQLSLSGFDPADHYDYTVGATYTGSATYATATVIPANGMLVSTLANPAVATTYTIRVFNAAGCYVDVQAVLQPTTCIPACTPPTPTGTPAALCGTGTVTLSASGCDATYPAVWYSDAALTTQVGTGNSFTTPSLTSTTTYYVACVKDATCKSAGVAVMATINALPAASAVATPATCNAAGTAANNDAQLSLSGFGATDHYEYNVGATYTGSATYATATAIPASGVLVSTLANPAVATTYTIRVFNATGCYVDVTATLQPTICTPNCTPPTPTGTPAAICGTGTVTLSASGCDATYPAVWYSDAALTTQVGTGNSFTTPSLTSTTTYYVACVKDATCKSAGVAVDATINALPTGVSAVATPATCNAAGTAANNDAQLVLSGFGATDQYDYTVGATYTGSATYATATAIPVNGILVSTLANPAVATTYTIRVFNAAGCYVDVTATVQPTTCTPNCTPPTPTGTPAALCGTGTMTLSASGCDATYPAVWYSDAALTTQVGTGNSFTTPSLTSTTTYYVACVKDATCKSAGVAVMATINTLPTGVSALATPATCNAAGTAANNDGQLSLSGFGATDHYEYNVGATYTGSATYATATAIPASGILVSTLANPAVATTYTIRVFNAAGCYVDVQAVLQPTTCNPNCTPPTPTGTPAALCGTGIVTLSASGCDATYPAVWYSDAALTTQVGTGNSFTTPSLTSTTTYYVACVKDATCKSAGVAVMATINALPTGVSAVATPATCNAAGTAANNDGQLSLSGFGATDHYEYNVGATYTGSATYATATAIPASGILVSTLANPAVATTYTIRVFNATGCYVDVQAVLQPTTCNPNCTPPTPTGTPAALCGTGTMTLSASGCDATYPAVWYSDAALTTQVGTGNSFTTPSLTSTTTYYVACVKDATCKSAGVAVVATINALPVLSLSASSTLVTVGTPVSLSAVGCTGTVVWSTGATGASISVTPINTTNVYSATCTTVAGCTATASITVNTTPSASLIVISATVCYGTSATLTASGCTGTISWNTGGTGASLVTPALTASTNYTATCTTGTGSTTSAVGTVTVLAQPVLSLSASSTSVTAGTPVSLSAIGCTGSIAWNTGATTSVISVTPANPTNVYSATCTTGPGCTKTASITVNTTTVCSVSLTTSSLPIGIVGQAYSATLTATGGTAPYSFSLASGSLPAGLTLSSTGVISGTPTAAGSFSTTIRITDSQSCSVTVPLPVISIELAPVCSLSAIATPGQCSSATNTYSVSGTLSLTNNTAGGTILLSDGTSLLSVSVASGVSSVVYSLMGLVSDGLVHTLTATLSGCGTTSVSYTAPTSCTYSCAPPVHVCKGSNYAIGLSTTAGQSSYQWYRDGVAIQGATTSSYTATQAGSYSVVVNGNVVGQCPDGSCCPVLIVEDSVALYQASAQAPTCNTATNSANADGRLLVSNWKLNNSDPTTYYYQVSSGSSFNAGQVIAGGATVVVPSDGVLVANLANPGSVNGQSYTVRITNGLGCYRDVVVNLAQTNCACPPAKCVPFVVKRVR